MPARLAAYLDISVHEAHEQGVKDEPPQGMTHADWALPHQPQHALCEGDCKGRPFRNGLVRRLGQGLCQRESVLTAVARAE